jgi:hypothetical protein
MELLSSEPTFFHLEESKFCMTFSRFLHCFATVAAASGMVIGIGSLGNAQTVRQDTHQAGRSTKDAAKKTGVGAKRETKKAYHSSRRGTRKMTDKTKRGTVRGYHKAKSGAIKGYDKTKEGAEHVVHGKSQPQ